MLIDRRNGPTFDTSPTGAPTRWLVLASSPRTGSTLLTRLLAETQHLGHPKEYLNPSQLRDWEVRLGSTSSKLRHFVIRGPAVALVGRRQWSEARRRDHLERVAARRSGPTGWMMLKVHHHHWERFFGPVPPPLPGLRWLRIRRNDQLGQAISWARARQTGAWATHRTGWAPAIYRRGAIERALERITQADQGWDTVIGDSPHLDVSYEELVDDPLSTVNRALAWADVPSVTRVTLPLTRQADATSLAWRERFLAGR